MNRILISLIGAALALCACGPVTALPPATLTPLPTPALLCAEAGTHAQELTSGAYRRQYRLHVPPGYKPGQATPLVLGFHGNGGYADQFETYTGLATLADEKGFIFVSLQGLGETPTWDTGPHAGNRDLQFVSDLLDHLQATCNIDPARVYAVGHSRGGGMVNLLACQMAERFAAIGGVSGAYQDSQQDCHPSRPVAVVAVHGRVDPIISYSGIPLGGVPPAAYMLITTPIPQWASSWAERNGCDLKFSVFVREEQFFGQRWSGCHAGADVELYTLNGWGHGWSGAAGAPAGEFDTAGVVWDFLARHPRP